MFVGSLLGDSHDTIPSKTQFLTDVVSDLHILLEYGEYLYYLMRLLLRRIL